MSKKFTIITCMSQQGLFANVLLALQKLDLCRLSGSIPVMYWHSSVYDSPDGYNGSKGNVWDYYFEPVSKYTINDLGTYKHVNKYGGVKINNPDVEVVGKYRNVSEPHQPEGCWNVESFPPNPCLVSPTAEARAYVNNLINEQIHIKPHIIDKVNKFYEKKFKNRFVIGIHSRACNDHMPAQGQNFLGQIEKYTKRILNDHKDAVIFIATDLESRIVDMKKLFGDRVCYQDIKRSPNSKPLQYNCKPKKKHNLCGPLSGEEAIRDCLLLSKTNMLLHGFSNISSCALYLNTQLDHNYVCKYNKEDKEYLGIS